MPLWKAAEPEVYVADAALYSEENLEALGKTPWISRVPATIAEAQWLMQTLPPAMFAISHNDNYAIAEVCSTYAGVRQGWSNETILQEHKNQQSCERGFRFLKDPLFFASRLFVKLPQRVAALAMIMGLCLLVYCIGQRQLRSSLAEAIETNSQSTG